jgi:hypothetical protein
MSTVFAVGEEYLPLAGSTFGVLTIFLLYWITATFGHLPDGVSTPPISFLGTESPEHEVYQVGFTITGLCLMASMRVWQARIEPLLRAAGHGGCANACLIGGYLAGAGAIGQGVITLEAGILEKIQRRLPQSSQSVWHQGIAGFFFMGAAVHAYSATYVYVKCATSAARDVNGSGSGGGGGGGGGSGNADDASASAKAKAAAALRAVARSRGSAAVKGAICAVTVLAAPLAQALHPAHGLAAARGTLSPHQAHARSFAVAGLAQYVAVGAYIAFFGSYTLDFVHLKTQQHLAVADEGEGKKRG